MTLGVCNGSEVCGPRNFPMYSLNIFNLVSPEITTTITYIRDGLGNEK